MAQKSNTSTNYKVLERDEITTVFQLTNFTFIKDGKFYGISMKDLKNSKYKDTYINYDRLVVDNILVSIDGKNRIAYFDEKKDCFRPLRIKTPILKSYGINAFENGKKTNHTLSFIKKNDCDTTDEEEIFFSVMNDVIKRLSRKGKKLESFISLKEENETEILRTKVVSTNDKIISVFKTKDEDGENVEETPTFNKKIEGLFSLAMDLIYGFKKDSEEEIKYYSPPKLQSCFYKYSEYVPAKIVSDNYEEEEINKLFKKKDNNKIEPKVKKEEKEPIINDDDDDSNDNKEPVINNSVSDDSDSDDDDDIKIESKRKSKTNRS